MKNITQHTGKLRLIERLPNSRNGNPRYLCAIMDQQPNNDLGWTFRTQVDAMHGYEIPNYFDSDIDVTVTIGTHYGHPTLNTIHRAKLACHYCGGNCNNNDPDYMCDGFAGDIDGLFGVG